MKISFFEEFPTPKNLAKISLIKWPCSLYIAAKSVDEFLDMKRSICQKNIDCCYWPVLAEEEGYWLSPFSSTKALRRIIAEIYSYKNIRIMWDAELPFRKPSLFMRLDRFVRNKKLIRKLFKEHGKNILVSEYPTRNKLTENIFAWLGVTFSPKKYGNRKITMYYTSLHHSIKQLFLPGIEQLHKQHGKNFLVGLGVIATGIYGDEPLLSAKGLRRDLEEMQKLGIEEVVIFRLGGLNKKYLDVISSFA